MEGANFKNGDAKTPYCAKENNIKMRQYLTHCTTYNINNYL